MGRITVQHPAHNFPIAHRHTHCDDALVTRTRSLLPLLFLCVLVRSAARAQTTPAQQGQSKWTSTTYCLTGHVYKQCATSDKATPPNPPHFPDLGSGN